MPIKSLSQQAGGTALQDEMDEVDLTPTPTPKPAKSESQLMVDEVLGQISVASSVESVEVEAHEEVIFESGAEASEEIAEATPEQLAATLPESENVLSDLRGIEGFEELAGEETTEVEETAKVLPDAGTAVYGQQEFFGLGTLAASIIPTLISKIGPKVARAVVPALSKKGLALLKSRKNLAGPVGAIAKLLFEAAPVNGVSGESEEEVDPMVVEQTAAVIETIIGVDQRVRIQGTTKVPWRRICALRIQMPSGATFRGTGFLIGPRVLATAGHCVYMHNQGGWARKIQVIPGCNGSQHPFGEVIATTFRSTKGWVGAKKPESDYGCIVLPAGAFPGQAIGSFGFGVFPTADLLARPAVVAGYPGDKPFAELWGMAAKLKAVTPLQLIYDIDTVGGQSGCPVFVKKGAKRYVVGIHNYGAATGNSATRVTQEVFQNFQRWSKLGIVLPAPLPVKTATLAAAA